MSKPLNEQTHTAATATEAAETVRLKGQITRKLRVVAEKEMEAAEKPED